MPDITFINSPRSEDERRKFTAKVIAQGFYQKHGFVVLSEPNPKFDEKVQVVYPVESNYSQIVVEKWKREWASKEREFWKELENYIPGADKLFEEIEVRITKIGTVSSVGKLGQIAGRKAIYYLRDDVDISHLASMIINNLLYNERHGMGITWSKREALMDFIMTRPRMKKIFPNFRPVMSQLSRVPAKVKKASEKYLRELGIGKPSEEFDFNKMRLSKLEKKVMKMLIDHQGELVEYDGLADCVWGVGEFKTFWAINKLVGRLRQKLSKQGIDGVRLVAVRGQGYLLQ